MNTQSTRQRFWDGQDKSVKDDISTLHGNHLFSFGGSYQRDFDYHSRTDNGSAVNNQISYLSTSSGFNWTTPVQYIPTSVPTSSYSNWRERLFPTVLGHDQFDSGNVYARIAEPVSIADWNSGHG